jgi:hypothetical protein
VHSEESLHISDSLRILAQGAEFLQGHVLAIQSISWGGDSPESFLELGSAGFHQ